MIHLPKTLSILLASFGVVGVAAVIAFTVRTPAVELADVFPEVTEQPTTTPPPVRVAGTPLLTETENHLVVSERFSLQIPEGWILEPSKDANRNRGTELWYGNILNEKMDEAYTDPDVVRVIIKDVLKNGRTFEEVAAELSWNESDIAERVAFMKSEGAELFPDFSEKDVRVTASVDLVGSAKAFVSSLQCLKPCYNEGGAETNVQYLIEDTDRVYILDINAATTAQTADQLNAATAVIKTFRLIPSAT